MDLQAGIGITGKAPHMFSALLVTNYYKIGKTPQGLAEEEETHLSEGPFAHSLSAFPPSPS